MTIMFSLKSRLALARVALRVRADQADPEALAPLLNAGVDLVILGAGEDTDGDVEIFKKFRSATARSKLLIATEDLRAGAEVQADVVHVARPGWRTIGGIQKPHRWSLIGRDARDQRTVGKPGDAYDYLFVGPLDGGDPNSRLLQAALNDQPTFSAGAKPWFATGDLTVADVSDLVARGVGRIALPPTVIDQHRDPAAFITAVRYAVQQAWATPEAKTYALRSARL